ncbi:unnamed protein product [Pipistrellus nathusii]|uniref:Uncharacterized protein n=1 Tax=Pipistrellus nathusii TaxID=59473 RepID=A0ABP0A6T4_PIPNA
MDGKREVVSHSKHQSAAAPGPQWPPETTGVSPASRSRKPSHDLTSPTHRACDHLLQFPLGFACPFVSCSENTAKVCNCLATASHTPPNTPSKSLPWNRL